MFDIPPVECRIPHNTLSGGTIFFGFPSAPGCGRPTKREPTFHDTPTWRNPGWMCLWSEVRLRPTRPNPNPMPSLTPGCPWPNKCPLRYPPKGYPKEHLPYIHRNTHTSTHVHRYIMHILYVRGRHMFIYSHIRVCVLCAYSVPYMWYMLHMHAHCCIGFLWLAS